MGLFVHIPGSYICSGSILGVSIASAPIIAHAMDGELHIWLVLCTSAFLFIFLVTVLSAVFFFSLTRVFCLQLVAGDALVDDHESQDLSEEEIDVHHLLRLARKLWLPAFFFLTVCQTWTTQLQILFIKLTLFLLSTKPSPFSVYVFVDKVRYCINNLTL